MNKKMGQITALEAKVAKYDAKIDKYEAEVTKYRKALAKISVANDYCIEKECKDKYCHTNIAKQALERILC